MVVTLNWLATMVLYVVGEGLGVWRYLPVEIATLLYFYWRWSARDAQHRQLHFILMCCFLAQNAYYFFQLAIRPFAPHAFAMSPWWYQLFSNCLFVGELLLIAAYGVLHRRARRDRGKWKTDVDRWFTKK